MAPCLAMALYGDFCMIIFGGLFYGEESGMGFSFLNVIEEKCRSGYNIDKEVIFG